jgi:sec-independent protein translocase protein TatB
MFDISWSELLLIGIVALIVIGPKELPGALRTLGQWMAKIRRMASEFQGQFQEAMREAEMADLKKQAEELNDAAKNLTQNFDPFDYVPKEETKPAAPSVDATTTAPTPDQPIPDAGGEPVPAAQTAAGPEPSPEPATAPPAPDTPAPDRPAPDRPAPDTPAADTVAPPAGGRAA